MPLGLGLDALARYPFLTPTQAFVLAKAARHFATLDRSNGSQSG
ncbi:hypothetical protein [Actinacidiphila oryziradicis]|nr:hypothetical protein [Actinacidiphila oryziradicis]